MRVLCCSTANDGHFQPMVPLLRACADAGHAVAVAAPASYAAAVVRSGFQHLPFADTDPSRVGPIMGSLLQLGFEESNRVVVREIFGRLDAQAAFPGVRDSITAWRPDVILREPAELGSLAAATVAGVPTAYVRIGVQEMDRYFVAELAEPLLELEAVAGLDRGRLAETLAEEPVFSQLPESLDRAGDPRYLGELPVVRHTVPAHPPGSSSLPVWGDAAQPLVYVTFGTVTGSLPPFRGLFARVAAALAEVPARVLMTVGSRVDFAELGSLPPNLRVEPWWPQGEVLLQAAAVLGHGGFGTTLGAAAAGVPQVVAPLFTTDQAINGRHLAAYGAGRTLALGADVAEHAAAELTATLTEPAYRSRAESLAAEIAELPPVTAVVAELERLAADRARG